MLVKRVIFVCFLVLVSIGSIAYMNSKYDKLARYPYELTEQQRTLILENMSEDQIEYIIEYAIYHSVFIDDLQLDGYNVFLNEYYRQLEYHSYTGNRQLIIDVGNIAYEKNMSVEQITGLLYHYRYDQVLSYLSNTQTQNLKPDPNSVDTVILESETIMDFVPRDIVNILYAPTLYDDEIMIRREAESALGALCTAMEEQFESECGTMYISKGYTPYEELVVEFEEAIAQESDKANLLIPGHSEYQLGLLVDIGFKNVKQEDLSESLQYIWLLENMKEYGFILRNPAYPNVIRYTGVEAAQAIDTFDSSIEAYYDEK